VAITQCRHLWTFHFNGARDSNTVWKQFFMVVQVESSLCLIKHHGRKAYGDVKLWFYALLTLAPDGFMPKWLPSPPPTPKGRRSHSPLNKRCSESQSWSEHFEEKKSRGSARI